jgi:hypothetical protein
MTEVPDMEVSPCHGSRLVEGTIINTAEGEDWPGHEGKVCGSCYREVPSQGFLR